MYNFCGFTGNHYTQRVQGPTSRSPSKVRFNPQVSRCMRVAFFLRYRTVRLGGAQNSAFQTILCPVFHRRHNASDAHCRREEEIHSLGSGFILVRTHLFPPYARKLSFPRDWVDTSTLLVKVYQKLCFKKQDELVGTLTYTIEEITTKLNNGGTNNLCKACSTDTISAISI